jgi:hypothetical protein
MKGKMMKPAFAKKGYMDGGMVQGYKNGGKVMPVMKMADGGMACGHAGKLTGKNMKKGSK